MSKVKKEVEKKRQKILVYGITGLVGVRVHQLLGEKFKIIGPPHSYLDITNKNLVQKHIRDVKPDQILFLAGLTKVDEAQLNKNLAFLMNAEAVKYAATQAAKTGVPFHYLSTDAIFDGKLKERAYTEDDEPGPVSVYGKSKLKGEQIVLSLSKRNSVIRTSMVYSSFHANKKDFARFAYESMKYKKPISGIVDQYINPTFVDDLVYAISTILQKRARGIYHVASIGLTTNYKFLNDIARAFKFNEKLVTKVTFKEFFKDKPAPRQQYSVLSTVKFNEEFGSNILHPIKEGIQSFKEQISKLEEQPIDL